MRKLAPFTPLLLGSAMMLAACGGTSLGNCYDSNNCMPAGNPPPGWGGMTQAECKAKPGGSWREVNRQAKEVGPCIAPP